MNIRLFILLFFALLFCSQQRCFAQSKTTGKKLTAADSLKAARKYALDSAAASRAYKNSKKYKDSVVKSRKARIDSIRMVRQSHLDSLKEIREEQKDSLTTVRQVRSDSIGAIQKERAAKIASTTKYKASKRFQDSVAIVRRTRLDSIKGEQKAVRDKVAGERKKELDIMKAAIKKVNDSAKTARLKSLDSMKIVRKRRTDSLAKVRLAKTNSLKTKEKKTEEKKKLALELKMKSKHEAFTNKSMLKKKWSPMRRFTQNSFTHYNYYYNANRKMEEAKANMMRGIQKENFDSLIKLYPFDPDRDSSLLAGDMDSIIRRISVGIQIHDPRVKWANDLYLIMGEAYYYKGNYQNAAATFRYIINSDEENKKSGDGKKLGSSIVDSKHGTLDFLKHKSVHNDAILWLAQTFVQAKQVENGQAVLSLLSSEPSFPEEYKGKLAAGKAFAYLADQNYTAATDELFIVMEDDNLPYWLRMRAAFLNGQLMQQSENYDTAVICFERCLDFFPKLEMDFFARKLIAYNTLMAGRDVANGIKPLKNILHDPKYSSYYDQIYFVLGKISAKANKTNDAIIYLKQSATTPKATKAQKAISYAELGEVYYGQGMYGAAKNAYDSAAKYAGANPKDATVKATLQKSKGLNEIAQPTAIIEEQDSLLLLASLSKNEQQRVVRKFISQLEKEKKDSIRKALESASDDPAPAEAAAPTEAAANWYFSNPTTMQQGALDFKRKWGSRTLTDNWRRAGAVSAMLPTAGATNAETTGSDDDKTETIDGLPTEASLLAKIPNSAEQKRTAEIKLQKAYLALANAYLKQLDDYVKSGKTLDTLDKRFPNHGHKEEELYLRYQLAIRQSKLQEALAFSTALLQQFPNSTYAPLLKPREEKKGAQTVAAYYEDTYNMILQHKYPEALARMETAKKEYNDPVFNKRFQIAEAMTYAGMANYTLADSLINKFITTNTGDSLVSWASNVAAYIKDVKANGVPTWYKNLPAPESGVANAETKIAVAEPVKPSTPPKPKRPADVPYGYSYKATDEHYCLLLLNSLDSRLPKLKKALGSMDSATGTNHILLVDMYSPVELVVLVKSFAGAKDAMDFVDTLQTNDVLVGYTADELVPMVISATNYKKMFYEKDSFPYLSFYKSNYAE